MYHVPREKFDNKEEGKGLQGKEVAGGWGGGKIKASPPDLFSLI